MIISITCYYEDRIHNKMTFKVMKSYICPETKPFSVLSHAKVAVLKPP